MVSQIPDKQPATFPIPTHCRCLLISHFGNAPRTTTSVLTPGTRNAELALFKEFPLTRVREGMRLEFRAEATNALNHPQFKAPNTNAASGTYGQIVPNGPVTLSSPRELQLGLKVYF